MNNWAPVNTIQIYRMGLFDWRVRIMESYGGWFESSMPFLTRRGAIKHGHYLRDGSRVPESASWEEV